MNTHTLTLLLCATALFFSSNGFAANPNGDLRIEVFEMHNLVVDHNIQTPAGSSPSAVYIGVRICNDGTNDLTDVFAHIGNFIDGTPGVYPQRTVTEANYAGTFSFKHEGGKDDATRYIGTVPAETCITQYWLISYPLIDKNGNRVAGAIADQTDDLWLPYDVWATANDAGTTLAADERNTLQLRAEISASANKIWPNNTAKVPNELLAAFPDKELGWRENTLTNDIGSSVVLEGIWFDLGKIEKGFDNNGDFIPDFNAMLQPIGNPSTFDANCFKLVKVTGILAIQLNDGTNHLIEFEDQFHFSDLPQNNTGGVGMVFYEFAVLDNSCVSSLSPYQEVASGKDNEKFNADYGSNGGNGVLISGAPNPNISFTKTGPATAVVGNQISYQLEINNGGTSDLGMPEYALPVVIQETIPENTMYASGTAAGGHSLPASNSVTVLYSTDKGNTWTATEPTPAATVTDIRWWFKEKIYSGESATVTFDVVIDPAFTGTLILNNSGVSIGGNEPFLEDDAVTKILGTNTVNVTVFGDDGAGSGLVFDGTQNGGENGLPNITVWLYADTDSNGKLDDTDILIQTLSTNGSGVVNFPNVADGDFIVKIDEEGTDIPSANILSTEAEVKIIDLGTNPGEAVFGIGPAYITTKTLKTPSSVYESEDVIFDLDVEKFLRAETTTAQTGNVYELWVEQETLGDFIPSANLYGEPDDVFSAGSSWGNELNAGVFNSVPSGVGNITKVEMVVKFHYTGTLTDDNIAVRLAENGSPLSAYHVIPKSEIQAFNSAANAGEIVYEVTGDKSTWSWSDFTNTINSGIGLQLQGQEVTGTDGAIPHVDAIGLRITTQANISSADCNQVDLWINNDYQSSFSPISNLYGAPDGNFATGVWGWVSNGEIFNVPATNTNITKVELVSKLYYTGTLIDDEILGRIIWNGKESGYPDHYVSKSEFSSFNSSANAGELLIDITDDHSSWDWSQFSSNSNEGWSIFYQAHSLGSDDGAIPYFDAIGFRITTDSLCSSSGGASSGNLIDFAILPMKETYNPALLEYVSASLPPDSINVTTGEIFWEDAKDNLPITVKYKALSPSSSSETTDMPVCAEAPTFLNGKKSSTECDSKPVTILDAGSFTGVVWSDLNNNGWQGTTGFDASDTFIPGVTLNLIECSSLAGNNSCNVATTIAQTAVTDDNGSYTFNALTPGYWYQIEVDVNSLPGNAMQTGDTDDDPNDGSGNGGTCGNGGSNAKCNNNWNNNFQWFEVNVDLWGSQSMDLTDISFGYTINPEIYGEIWEDTNGNGTRDIGEKPLQNVSIDLQSNGCTPGSNCTTVITDAEGKYTFTNLNAGTNYNIIPNVSSLPSGTTWNNTYESDGTANNNITKTAVSGQVSGSHDFGFVPSGNATIGNLIFADFDRDGNFNNTDDGISNLPVSLYKDADDNGILDFSADAVKATKMTDASGNYSFTDLESGNYFVVVDSKYLPYSFIQSVDPDEAAVCTTCDSKTRLSVDGTSTYNNADFGYSILLNQLRTPATNKIGNFVWIDKTGFEKSTQGISNIRIELQQDVYLDGNFKLIAETESDKSGYYLFENLHDGIYKIKVDLNDSKIPTDNFGNKFMISTLSEYLVEISGGTVTKLNGIPCLGCNSEADFGFYEPAAFSGLIFWDANENGNFDWNEEGIGDVNISLLNNMGAVVASLPTSDGSDGRPVGTYIFSQLDSNIYTIKIDETDTDLAGAALTIDPSSDGVICSDPSAIGCDHEFTTTTNYGINSTWINFGYRPIGNIGNKVWEDFNGDGFFDLDEYGYANAQLSVTNLIAVTIGGTYYPAGTFVETILTDFDGNFSFKNLPDANYRIDLILPTDYTATYDADGGTLNSATVAINGGRITSIGNSWCAQPECNMLVDFGIRSAGTLNINGSICIDDATGDGNCSTGGEALIGLTDLYLFNSSNLLVGKTTTEADGTYSFTNLSPDTYTVAVPTGISPLDLTNLTTTAANSPAFLVQGTLASVYQKIAISRNTSDLDFAFKYSRNFDFGDLPAPYPTLLNDSPKGAYHVLSSLNNLFLGNGVDSEIIGTNSAEADGDDLDGTDDEDGIDFINPNFWEEGTVASGKGGTISAEVTGAGILIGWIDFDQNGDFNGTGEMIFEKAVKTGSHTINFDIPTTVDMSAGIDLYARFRLFEDYPLIPKLAYTGRAKNGEVEDYYLRICADDCSDLHCLGTINASGTSTSGDCLGSLGTIDLTTTGTAPYSYIWSDMTPEAHWNFENQNTADFSGNGHDLVGGFTNTLMYSDDKIEGRFSMLFDGDDYLRYSTDGGFMETSFSKAAISGWIKPSTLSGIQVIFEEGSASNGMALRLNGNQLEGAVRNGSVEFNANGITFPTDGQWHHVALVFDEGAFSIYLDGIAGIGTTASFTSVDAHNGNGGLGYQDGDSAFGFGTGYFYSGLMDDMRYFSGISISAHQVADMARNDGDRTQLETGDYKVTTRNGAFCGLTVDNTFSIVNDANVSDGGNIATDQTLCENNTPTVFSNIQNANGGIGGAITYQWEYATDLSNWTPISGAVSETYTAPALTQTTHYRRAAVRVGCIGDLYSDTVTLTITNNIGDAGNIIGAEEKCSSYAPTEIIGSTEPTGGLGGSVEYQWQFQTTSTGWTNISGAITENFTPPTVTESIWFRRGARRTPCSDWVFTSPVLKAVAYNYSDGGVIDGDEIFCGGYNPSIISNVSDASGGENGSQYYRWEQNINGAGWTSILGAISTDYDPAPITETTQYRRGARRNPCSIWVYSNTITKTVKPYPTAEIESYPVGTNGFLCEQTDYDFAAKDAGSGATYLWDFGSSAIPKDATGRGSHTVQFDVPSGNIFRTVEVEVEVNLDGCTSIDTDSFNVRPGLAITGLNEISPSSCGGSDGEISLSLNTPSGADFQISIDGGDSWGAVNQDLFENLSAGIYNIQMRYDNGDCTEDYDVVSLTDPFVPNSGIIENYSSECVGETLTFNAQNNSLINKYSWDFGSGASPATANGLGPHYVEYSTSGNKVVTLRINAFGCSNTYSDIFTVTQNFNDGGTISEDQDLCGAFNPAPLTSSGSPTGGMGGSIQYEWEYRNLDVLGGWDDWQTVSNGRSEFYNPSNINEPIQFRRKARRSPCYDWVTSNIVTLTPAGLPNASYDLYSTVCPGQSYGGNLRGNDLNVVEPSFSIYTPPTNGSVLIFDDGNFLYTPNSTFCGEDEFIYEVCNYGGSCCDTATVKLILTDVIPPILVNIPADLTIHCDEEIPIPPFISAIENCQTVNIGLEEISTQGIDNCSLYDYEITRVWTSTDYCGNSTSAAQVITIEDQTAPDIYRIYTLPNGKKMVAGIMENVANRWKSITLPIMFNSKPLIFTQLVTETDGTPVSVQTRNISTSQFEMRLHEEEGNDNLHGRESIAWFAIEEGINAGEAAFEVGKLTATNLVSNVTFSQNHGTDPLFFTSVQTAYESDPVSVRTTNLTANGAEVRLQEDQSADLEFGHIPENMGYFVLKNSGDFMLGSGEVIGESGKINVDMNWQTISFNHTYANPVVVANVLSNSDSNPVFTKVKNITPNGFEIRLEEWDYQDKVHGAEAVSYLVFEGSMPFEMAVSCDSIPEAMVQGLEVIAVDNCDFSVSIEFNESLNTENCAPNNLLTRSYSATDECGNTATFSHQIQVYDNTAPDFTVPADVWLSCVEDINDLNLTGDVTDEWDNCQTNLEANYVDIFNGSFDCDQNYVVLRIWSLKDYCGNVTEKTQNINIRHQGVKLSLKARLQGALHNTTDGLMRDDLRRLGLIPFQEPYSDIKRFTHFGSGGGETVEPSVFQVVGKDAIVDWVFVEIRHSLQVDSVLETRSALVQRDGDVVDVDGFSPVKFITIAPGSYNIVIKHRSHLGVMTGTPKELKPDTPEPINMIDQTVSYWGDHAQKNQTAGDQMWAGDFNQDGKTVFQGPDNDIVELFVRVLRDEDNDNALANFIRRAYDSADFDMNGEVIFQGPNNDRTKMLMEVIFQHPGNTNSYINFIVPEQLPE